MNDQAYMAKALVLAARGRYSTHPNPRVGCIVVRDGQVVGQGWHVRAGEPHAEIHALREAGEQARGATLYVTLEPCSHQGRTGPCAEAVLKAGVRRVVAAMQDPNPLVAGNGLALLTSAGMEVCCGVLEEQARALNLGFVKRMQSGLPYVIAKLAMSLDGRTAMASGQSQWITGGAARSAVQRLRARCGTVLSGADSVLQDGSRLTVREAELGIDDPELRALAAARQPRRVLVDGRQRVPLDAPFFRAGPALVASTSDARQDQYRRLGHELLALPDATDPTRVDLPKLLRTLADDGCNELLLEAGAGLAGAFARLCLVDEYRLFVAPKFLGSTARPLLDLPLERMQQAHALRIEDIRAVGEDWLVLAKPAL